MQKLEKENEDFEPNRYMFDNFDEEQLEEVKGFINLKWEPSLSLDAMTLETLDKEQNEDESFVNLAMVLDILFASMYE